MKQVKSKNSNRIAHETLDNRLRLTVADIFGLIYMNNGVRETSNTGIPLVEHRNVISCY